MKKKIEYLSDHPHLVEEWHPTKNGVLSPTSVKSGSKDKLWWRCSKNCNHEWQTATYLRVKKHSRCPYCAGKKTLPENSFATLFTGLLEEWDAELNLPISPYSLAPKSNKKVYWRCKVDTRHSWITSVALRTGNGTGCPFCSGRKVLSEDSFGEKFPELAKELDPIQEVNPFALSPFSKTRVDWLCLNNPAHKWATTIDSRTRLKSGCPFCAGQRIYDADNYQDAHPKSLARQNRSLAAEWDSARNFPLTPFNTMSRSGKKVWWVCGRFAEHKWAATPNSRTRGTGCPHCTRQTSMPELRIYTELKFIFSDAVLRKKIDGVEMDILIPNLKIAIEFDGYYFHKDRHTKDLNKNIFLESHGIILIRVRETGLKLISENDLNVEPSAELSKKILDDILRLIIRVNSNANTKRANIYLIKDKFQNDKLYQTYIEYFPNPIPEQSLAVSNSDAKNYWDFDKNEPLTPENFTTFSTKTVWWRCGEGHSWRARIAGFSGGKRCPFCSSNRLSNEKTFAFMHPHLVHLWHFKRNHPSTPEDIFAYSGKKVWWKCSNYDDHEWEAPPRNLSIGKGCPFCAGRKVSRSMSIGNTNPNLASQWDSRKNHPLTPFDVLPGSGKKVWWKCDKGHSWDAAPLTRKRSGCGQCHANRVKTRTAKR